MSRKNLTITFFALTILSTSLFSQSWKLRRWEMTAGIGSAHIFGDFSGVSSLNNNNLYGLKDFTFQDTRPSLLLAMRYKITESFSARMNFLYGRGVSNSANGGSVYHKDKNVIARSNMIEITPQAEWYFLKEGRKFKSSAIFNRRGMVNNFATFSGYLFAGVGGVMYNTNLEGIYLTTRPDEVETGKNSFTAVIPGGVGFKYVLDSRFVLGFEVGGRYTFTDYLDGFSSDYTVKDVKDIYYFSSLNVSYKLKTNRDGWPEFGLKPGSSGGLPFGAGGSPKARSAKAAKSGGGDPNAGFFKNLFDFDIFDNNKPTKRRRR